MFLWGFIYSSVKAIILIIDFAQSIFGVRWEILLKVSTKKLAKMN